MGKPRIITRKEAGLALPVKFSGWMRLPAPEVWIHHSVTSFYDADPIRGLQEIQQIAFRRGFLDFSYSWAVFLGGEIGEGRGWGVVGAHTEGHNTISHGIVFVGNYMDFAPTDKQIESVRWLIDEGIRLGKIAGPREERPNGGHRDLKATACPGTQVYSRIPLLRLPWTELAPPAPPPQHQQLVEKVRMNPVIKKGSSNTQAVKILQALLIVHARDLCLFFSKGDLDKWVDGVFGDSTEYVLSTWQERTKNLSHERGFAGPDTWQWLCVTG